MRPPPSLLLLPLLTVLLLLLLVLAPATTAARPTNHARHLATSDNDHDEAPWTGDGIFLPADLTERDVLVDGLLPGEQVGKLAAPEDDVGEGEERNVGTIGRVFTALLRRAREQERATPNVGGSANAFTRADGAARTAQRRNATVVLSSGPLNAAALSTAGSAAIAPPEGVARADARSGASTFANAIVDDHNHEPKDFAAAGSARGSTVAVGGPKRAAGAQTVLGTASAAGEQAAQGRAGLGIGPFLVLFNLGSRDGAQENGGAGSVGIGDRASTRLQVASLAEGRKSEQKFEVDDKAPKQEEEQHDDNDKTRSQVEEEGDEDGGGLQQLRTGAPSSSPSPKPPGPIAKATAKKRDKYNANDARRKEKKAENAKENPKDAALVEGKVSDRCSEEEEQKGKQNGNDGIEGGKCDEHGYRGGSALRAWADSADVPTLSTTSSGIADTNVRTGLTSEAAANRYGYSRGVSTGSASATGTRAARARVNSLSFGTGFVVKSTAATARVVERADGGKDHEDKEEGKEGKEGGGRRRMR